MTPYTAWTQLVPAKTIKALATLGPLGYTGKAPGTIGSLAGLIYYTAFFLPAGVLFQFLLIITTVFFAIGICEDAEIHLYKKDPSEVILDEFVAVPICFLGLPAYMGIVPPAWILIAGFVLFRLFDIIKPLGINNLQKYPGGLGVVLDDIGAALATCATLHLSFFILAGTGIIPIPG